MCSFAALKKNTMQVEKNFHQIMNISLNATDFTNKAVESPVGFL